MYTIRRAVAADAPVLARHRAEMFRDMGELPDDLYGTLVEAATAYFARAVPDGSYVAWVAQAPEGRDEIIGGAGLQLRVLLPRPHPRGTRLLHGPQGLIMNVFTE